MLLRRRKYESRRGFTLVELVVVLVILAILASVAVPAFSRQLETGRERKAVTEAQACVTAATGLGAQKYTEARTAYIQDSSKKIDTTLAAWAGEVRDERPTVTGTLAQREGTGEYLLTPQNTPDGTAAGAAEVKAAAGVELAEDEYIDLSDGLIHCKKCGGQRQTVVPCFGKSGYFMPRCICQCQREAEEQRKAAEERQRRMERIKRRKAQGLQDRYLYDYTFSNDNRQNPLMDKAHAYVENWKEAYKSNIGLLLFGDVGTGKSFFAGCIANALLDQDVPVLMTNFPTILNRLTGMFSEDRSEFIASFDEYDLLIIDDLGVERSTEYAMEQMFFVIDSRYRSRRPMIITTNLKLSELKNPPDLAHARIYDRILERCAPILFDGKNFREENAGVTRQAAKDIVNSKHD